MKIANLIIDVRPLQRTAGDSPLGRALMDAAQALIQTRSARLLASVNAPLPAELAREGVAVLRALPIRREAVTVISAGQEAVALAADMRPQMKPFVRLLTIEWRKGADGVEGYAVCGDGVPDAPVGRTAPTETDVSDLDQLQLNLLADVCEAFLVVDAAVASNKDIMRDLVASARGGDMRIVVLNGDSAVEAPEVSSLRLGAGGIRRLVEKAQAVLLPHDEPAALTSWEVEAWGGVWLKISAGDVVKSLSDLCLLAAEASSSAHVHNAPATPDVLAALPRQSIPDAPDRPRIALVTPMFPDKGGPPHSSLDLAMALTELCDLDIWTNSDMLPLHRKKVSNVYRLSDAFPADRYDEIIYVMGNHKMYAPIYAMMRRYGGVVIQHDAHMLDFLNATLGRGGLEDLLLRELGYRPPAHDIGALIKDLAAFGRPLLSPIVETAHGVIVHSPTARSVIDNLYDSHVEYFPVGMPYPFDVEKLAPDQRLQAKLSFGVDPRVPCIVSFGEVHLQKGAKQCLFVLNELRSWGVEFQFLFVGPIQSALRCELENYIENLSLTDYVKIVGAVSEEHYIRYLVAGDLVLQIRQIPFGQVSGALLDAVSAGMHGVASENLARSIEAPEMIRRVTDGASPTIYAEEIAQIIASKAYEKRPGPGWNDFTVKHDFVVYARNLLAMIFGRGREGR
ncbi:glycosyltransferase involved in cell wall biosynthesis [Brevundimonas bullata]|uniref:Glycosyltransferase involved in cell wall biosynthesis n=1 Tax=Brevundimonas bullata TaxID=13160 RepID=A0A7W7N4E9_9CAUL|nr:hypothetical protein [Brevundimonas bullata]MBB4798182.1 glycosyltransferase involved in cell wall biosynthesis [Brevundimonas bullata]MBB6383504.1 glycosyltransferase involved in cell wall biosynthesis [Brevundimonas bullata]